MPASPLDSAIYRNLMTDSEVAKLFSDSAEVRAMMLVEGALAKVQGAAGVIPETAAQAIHRASLELQIDPEGLSQATSQNAVPVPALVGAFRDLMQAPEHGQFLHFGATSQDIVDTGLALRLRQALSIFEARLSELLANLGALAISHAETAMLGRTYGQAAVPTSFGAVVSSWGAPLLRHRHRLSAVRKDVEVVSLSGAAGTLGVFGAKGPKLRAALADSLRLGDPLASRHSARDHIAALAAWLTLLTGSLGKFGEDILLMCQSEVGEISLADTGSSSTMPHKANPVSPSLLVAIATQTAALNTAVQSALVHRQQRDGSAWLVEWMSLPQMVLLAAKALAIAVDLSKEINPLVPQMAKNIDRTGGAVFAEALTFKLAQTRPRTEAEAEVKYLCQKARLSAAPLSEVARDAHPELDLSETFSAKATLGDAPSEALNFARSVKALN